MRKIRFLGRGLGMIGVSSLIPHAGLAQVNEAPAPPHRDLPRANGRVVRIVGQESTLADILDKIIWDPASRGSLIIVSPEQTRHAADHFFPMTPEERRAAQQLPEPEANGLYRLPELCAYFNRRLVNLQTVSILAPATMCVLNTTHLPKPDAYAGMSHDEKARLFESTFTPEQWKLVASPDGIGIGDLRVRQRDIFLSMLPDPFVVAPPNVITADASGFVRSTPSIPVTLTDDQRQGIRLALHRQVNWSFKTAGGGRIDLGAQDRNAAQPFHLMPPRGSFEPTSDVFGVPMVEEVPSHLKISQLPADWAALEKPIDLQNPTTVGGLIKQIAKQTGAELYCDSRYEDRKLYIRGASAQAGDLCRALAWGVTGTWRRLGNAFVLTDDLIGLGTRHAIIDNWMRQNMLLAEIRTREVDAALANIHPLDYAGWSEKDPLRPGDSLAARLDSNQQQSADDNSAQLFVPTADLPSAAQDEIGREIAHLEANRLYLEGISPNYRGQPIQPGGVLLSMSAQLSYDLPGIGRVDATDLGDFGTSQAAAVAGAGRATGGTQGGGNLDRLLGKANTVGISTASPSPLVADLPPIAFPAALTMKALMIAMPAGSDLESIAAEAHRRGFTQLWVETKSTENQSLQHAVQVGAANGLTVQAVVSLARPAPPDKPELLERTLLGDTLSGFASRWRRQLEQIHVAEEPGPDTNMSSSGSKEPTEAWRKQVLVDRILRGGDFLRCDDPETFRFVRAEIGRIASIPGLGGVVFRDIAAPGFDTRIWGRSGSGFVGTNPGSDPLLTMGYDGNTRLACLRKYGFDPVDLSPLDYGDQISVPLMIHRSGLPSNIRLPFFADFRTSGWNSGFAGESPATVGAKDSWNRWCDFRQDLDRAFVEAAAHALASESPNMSLMIQRTQFALGDNSAYFGSFDAPTAPTLTNTSAPGTAVPKHNSGGYRDPILEAARKTARVRYMSVKYDGTRTTDQAHTWFVGEAIHMTQTGGDWDGVVVDLTDAPSARVLGLLAVFAKESARSPLAAKAN